MCRVSSDRKGIVRSLTFEKEIVVAAFWDGNLLDLKVERLGGRC